MNGPSASSHSSGLVFQVLNNNTKTIHQKQSQRRNEECHSKATIGYWLGPNPHPTRIGGDRVVASERWIDSTDSLSAVCMARVQSSCMGATHRCRKRAHRL